MEKMARIQIGMGRTSVFFLAVMVVFFCSTGFSFAAEEFKIGIVDFQKVVSTSSPGKIAKKAVDKKGKELENSLKKKGNEIEKLKKDLDRESLVMTKDKFLEKQREIRIKINDFKALKASYAQQFKQMEARSITKIKNDVLGIVRKIGEKEGFKLIVERNETGAMYYPESMDITDEVIKEYNKTAVKK